MNGQLEKVFNYEGKKVRTVMIKDEPYFVAKDVCEVFGDSNYRRSVSKLDDDEKGVSQINTPGGMQEMTVINEAGLYSILFAMQPQKGNLPEEQVQQRIRSVKQFKRWVTHEVLPAIRKCGAYLTPEKVEEVLLNPDTLIKLATELKSERQKREEAEQIVEKQKPLVGFAEHVSVSMNSILVRELAKVASKNGIAIGEKRLYRKLREWGLIFQESTEPKQKYVDQGYFEVLEGVVETRKGTITHRTTKVTGKGQVYIINRLQKEIAS